MRATLTRGFAHALGGWPGARPLQRTGLGGSVDTVLRRLIAVPPPQANAVRVLGVDDWAWRGQQRYGTILMDLETNQVVDLLTVRSMESLRAWLERQPSVEVVARDRGGLYARAGYCGAPQARQVHDRFHLIANLTDAVLDDTRRLQSAALSKLKPDKAA